MVPRVRGNIGYFLFESDQGYRISIAFWPSDLPPNRTMMASDVNEIPTRSWLEKGFGFAVMGQGQDLDLDSLANDARSYYQATFTA